MEPLTRQTVQEQRPSADTLLLQQRLGYLLNSARNAMLGALDDELGPLGVTAAQFIVVLGVSHREAHTPSELCRLLACDSGAMTRLLDRIEAKGIVRRVRDLEDRRAIRIELTGKGRALQPQIMQAVTRVHERLVADFSNAELERLQDALRRLALNAAAKTFGRIAD